MGLFLKDRSDLLN